MKRGEVVLEGHDRPAEPALQPPDLDRAPKDALVRSPYLTAEEAAAYVRSGSLKAFYEWRRRHGVRAFGSCGKLLFTRKDLDEALKPPAERGRRQHFTSLRGGRS